MPERDIELLILAAKAAGEIALKHWKNDPQTWEKADGEGPVTEADLEVDAMLKDQLLTARHDYGWLSEESEDPGDRSKKSRVFVVDPIDGTRSFMAGERTWAHALAVVEDGRPIAGVVHLPARDKTYWATPQGAYLNGKPIRVGHREQANGADILAPRNVMDARNWSAAVPAFTRHFRPSLAYRMALVAEGRFDGMITFRDAWEWDIAAGAVIAEAAGAVVSNRYGAPLRFNSATAKLDGVLMGNRALHADLSARLHRGQG